MYTIAVTEKSKVVRVTTTSDKDLHIAAFKEECRSQGILCHYPISIDGSITDCSVQACESREEVE